METSPRLPSVAEKPATLFVASASTAWASKVPATLPQHLGQRIAKLSWLSQLNDSIVSLLGGEMEAWTPP
jgi:hypothetical protein